MTEEEKSQNPEIPKSTEQWGKLPGDATLEEVFSALGMEEETETISEEKMGEVLGEPVEFMATLDNNGKLKMISTKSFFRGH